MDKMAFDSQEVFFFNHVFSSDRIVRHNLEHENHGDSSENITYFSGMIKEHEGRFERMFRRKMTQDDMRVAIGVLGRKAYKVFQDSGKNERAALFNLHGAELDKFNLAIHDHVGRIVREHRRTHKIVRHEFQDNYVGQETNTDIDVSFLVCGILSV
ncbi:hypothetical protein SXCC_02791 [Gluconacetobacter sp. SXCC-1]|nr:hypothetical protein SXCC_02791 [Gluconacetobacter sp. SXCC-1]